MPKKSFARPEFRSRGTGTLTRPLLDRLTYQFFHHYMDFKILHTSPYFIISAFFVSLYLKTLELLKALWTTLCLWTSLGEEEYPTGYGLYWLRPRLYGEKLSRARGSPSKPSRLYRTFNPFIWEKKLTPLPEPRADRFSFDHALIVSSWRSWPG